MSSRSSWFVPFLSTIQANFKDLDKKWVVTPMEMRSLIESAGPYARYLEVSLLNSFGLKGLQLFLNLPFLRLRVRPLSDTGLANRDTLQHAFLEQQVKKSLEEIDIANQEFDYVFQESNYERCVGIAVLYCHLTCSVMQSG